MFYLGEGVCSIVALFDWLKNKVLSICSVLCRS